ncbi:MAG: T9SS type A sorting domain-containing protein [Ignavibacteriales bacterium]|nr:T9SS type A sorting domain-containing protein [Ignavibacteriales bacterium]
MLNWSRFHRAVTWTFLALSAWAHSAFAQDLIPMENGSHAICASPAVNDPRLIREAWANTRLQHPGLIESMQQRGLQKGTVDLRAGDQNLFWVYSIKNRVFDTVRAELKTIGTISYVWVALAEWNNGHVTSTEVDAVSSALERSTSRTSLDSTKGILQIDRQVYGDPPNINANFQKGGGDGRTHFLLCDIQDGWEGTGSYVAGYFYSVDVDPNSGAVNTSNKRDMLYIDSYPGIFYNGNRRTSTALSTLAHEFQHLIHWNYDPSEFTFFNEGLSEYAEYLSGFPFRSASGYFGNTNLMLTGWNSTVEDYSRAALWTRFVADQFGISFLKKLVQNPGHGTSAFDQSLVQSGYATSFSTTALNFFAANWLGTAGADPATRYSSALGVRPVLRADYVDPNVQRTDTLQQLGVQYISFAGAKNFRATFAVPSGVSVRAIESGPSSVRVRDVASGVEFTSPELGTLFTSVVFVVADLQPVLITTYSFSATGELTRFIAEESYDSGAPHPFSQGFSPYLGFGNNSATQGMAVRFQPSAGGNILRKARMMVAFNQEFSNGTALPSDSKNFVFHVWGDRNGRPGTDLIQPFLVSVNRDLYPFGSFAEIDLSAYERSLTNLKGPVYLGFMEDAGDSVGTYLAVDNFTQGDYSYVYRGPKYTRIPNTWETMTEVSAVNSHQLDGFNVMIRAVFEYSDSSAPPPLAVGYLQNPLLSEYIDVVAASSSDLRISSLSGSVTQLTGTSILKFSAVPGTSKVFLDSTQQLKGSGPVSIRVRGARKYGVFFSDTTVTFNARLLRADETATISTPGGSLTVSFDAGSVGSSVYVTACDGAGDPGFALSTARSSSGLFSVGPPDMGLLHPSAVRISGVQTDELSTIAQYRNGKWLAVPSVLDKSTGALSASLSRLGVLTVMKKGEVDGQVEDLPGRFALDQNYPNPFNPTTAISYQLSAVSSVALKVYDVLGREVMTLVNGVQAPGSHSVGWDGRDSRGEAVSSGVYLYQLRAGGSAMTRKMVLLR